jgi:hypothetical protein
MLVLHCHEPADGLQFYSLSRLQIQHSQAMAAVGSLSFHDLKHETGTFAQKTRNDSTW